MDLNKGVFFFFFFLMLYQKGQFDMLRLKKIWMMDQTRILGTIQQVLSSLMLMGEM